MSGSMVARQCLCPDGIWRGHFELTGSRWTPAPDPVGIEALSSESYFVTGLPVDMHCHGVGAFDFSDLSALDLDAVEALLAEEGVLCVLTLYLRRDQLDLLSSLAARLERGWGRGLYRHILGFALEGPLLSSPGGTPRSTVWTPARADWEQLARIGGRTLRYIVLSPDPGAVDDAAPSRVWITETLLASGILPALGHFPKDAPERSAASIRTLLSVAERHGTALISDHLFNDMPLAFRHAWRGSAQRATRERDIAAVAPEHWQWDSLNSQLGAVPAALLEGARDGAITLCMNFDGEHVDPVFTRRIVELLGTDRLIAMTDRVAGRRLGGRVLTMRGAGSLLYEETGIVAAGSQGIDRQMRNMSEAGISSSDIWNMFAFTPARVLQVESDTALPHISLIHGNGRRESYLAGWRPPARTSDAVAAQSLL